MGATNDVSNVQEPDSSDTDYRALNLIQTLAVVLFWGGIVSYIITLNISRTRFGIAFLGGAVLIYLLYEIEDQLSEGNQVWAGLFGGMSLATTVVTVYMYMEYNALINIRVGFNTPVDYVLAVVMLGIIAYLTYREYGLPFFSVIAVVVLYAYFGPYFPSWFEHTGLSPVRILQTGLLSMEGVYGNLTGIMGTWIAPFLLFAGLIQGYGAFDLIMRGARRASELVDSGVAQAAVVSSIAIGMVNGSATANTGITGSINIPMMKDNGVEAETAGAVEAVASSGGQIMPPVMGAAAFLMASLLAIPFFDVLVAGIVPALVFYIPVAFSVHYAVVDQLRGEETTFKGTDLAEKDRWEIAWQSVQFVIPFVLLLVALGVLQYSIMYSALITNVAMVLLGIAFPLIRSRDMGTVRSVIRQTFDGLERGARSTAPIAIVIAAIGLIVDVLLTTGIPTKLSLALIAISGGVFFVSIVLALIISIILGMGMPTAAAYLVVALLIAPTLVQNFAVPELAVHFFVFYAAILSALTPPIAVGIVVATGIAESDFWKTAAQGFRIGFPLFILPFLFMYHPEIVESTVSVARVMTGLTSLGGMLLLAYGANYSFSQNGRLQRWGYRGIYFILGFVAMFPQSTLIRIAAVLVGGVAYLGQTRFIRTKTAAET